VIDLKQHWTEYRRLVYDITLIRKHTVYSDGLEAALYRVQTIGVCRGVVVKQELGKLKILVDQDVVTR